MKNKSEKVAVLTLGCSKNVVDSENLISLLSANRIEIVEQVEDADTIVINTCGFIGPAKEESINVILQAQELKKQGIVNKVIVTGCLSQRYESDLKSQILGVDKFFGVDSALNILQSIKPSDTYHIANKRTLLTPNHYAYIKISEGCNHECSFCAIPLIRGKHKSREIDEILNEVKELVSAEVKEFNIIAQDTTYYGKDIYGKQMLPDLLDRISDIEGAEWIRLHYVYPTAFPTEILDVINKKSNIVKYIDIPLQHFSDKILKSMRRGTNSDYIRKLLETIRTKVDNVAIRSTFIVGYPGENNNDFHILYKFLEEYELDRVGVFTYSHEDNTHAFSMLDSVTKKVKDKRKEELMLLQQDISKKKNSAKIGKYYKTLIDGAEDNQYFGRTQHDAPEVDNNVIITTNEKIKIGNFYDVKITDSSEYDIYGVI